MRKLLWLLLVSAAFAQGPFAASDYYAEGPPSPGTAQQVGTRYVDIKGLQLWVCTTTTYANKAYTCNWTLIGPSQVVDAASFAGANWLIKVNAAAAALTNGGTVIVPDSIAGDGSATTGTIPSNVTLRFNGSGTFTACTINVGQFTKIYMDGAQIALNGTGCIGINLTTQALFQVNDKFILSGVRIDCQSKTNSTGIFLGANTAQVATYNVSVKNCTTVGVQFDGAQFSENYNMNVGNVTAGAGLIIHSLNPGGGGNSNTFYGLKLWSNAVGVLIYADTSIGQGQNYFFNPSMLSNTVSAMAVFGNAGFADVHWFGGAPESNSTGAASITINGKVIKKAMIYANLASVYLADVTYADASANPEILAENNSVIYMTNPNGYGIADGNLVQVDSTSASEIVGGIGSLIGQVQNVIAFPSTLTNPVGTSGARMFGAPVMSYQNTFPNGFTGNPQTPAVSSVGTGTTNSTAADPVYGTVVTATHAASAGDQNSTNNIKFGNLIASPVAATEDLYLSFLLKSSVNVGTYGSCKTTGYKIYGGGSNFSNVEMCLLAGQWTRVVIYLPNQTASTNISLTGFPLGSEGPTISYTGIEALAYNAQTPTGQYYIGIASSTGATGSNGLALTTPWSQLTDATGAMTVNNGTNNSTINQNTSSATLTYANSTAATTGASKSSPTLQLTNNVFNVSSLPDTWGIQNVCGTGNSPTCQLKFLHTGTGAGFSGVLFPTQINVGSTGQLSIDTSGNIVTTGNGTLVNAFITNYRTATNCAVNSASPAACGAAAAGAVVIPTTTTTYTINTTAVGANSRIALTWLTFASNLPSSPTCVAPSTTTMPTISAINAGVSFTITMTSTAGQTCPMYTIMN